MSAKNVTSGSAATKPPSLSLRFANSETSTTTAAVSKYFVMIQATISPWGAQRKAVCVVGALAPYNHGILLAGGARHVGQSPTYIMPRCIITSAHFNPLITALSSVAG